MLNKHRYFSKQVTVASPATSSHIMWRAPYACKILAVRAIRTGGSGAVVNAKVGADDVLSPDLSLTGTDWMAGVLDEDQVRMAAGDTLYGEIVSAAGSPTSLTIQVDLVIDADVR